MIFMILMQVLGESESKKCEVLSNLVCFSCVEIVENSKRLKGSM